MAEEYECNKCGSRDIKRHKPILDVNNSKKIRSAMDGIILSLQIEKEGLPND